MLNEMLLAIRIKAINFFRRIVGILSKCMIFLFGTIIAVKITISYFSSKRLLSSNEILFQLFRFLATVCRVVSIVSSAAL